MSRRKVLVSSVMILGLCAAALSDCPVFPWGECDCGLFGSETCVWGCAASDLRTGYYYDLETTAEKVCQCTGTVNASVNVSAQDRTKYFLAGGVNASYFSLQAGWEEETTYDSGCTTGGSCEGPCCVGPFYGHLRFTYKQRYYGKAAVYELGNKWCNECNGTGRAVGTLKTFDTSICGQTLYDQWVSEAPYTLGELCLECEDD